MEGAFNKVFLSSQAAPAKSYSFFLDMLGITIRYGSTRLVSSFLFPRRFLPVAAIVLTVVVSSPTLCSDEIATCCEVAYDSLRKADLAKLLYLEDASRVQEVIDAVSAGPLPCPLWRPCGLGWLPLGGDGSLPLTFLLCASHISFVRFSRACLPLAP